MDKKLYGTKKYYSMWLEIFKEALQGMNIGSGDFVETSGEQNVMRLIKQGGGIRTIFDVGANIGSYTKLLLECFPEAIIHCFEPAEKTYQALETNIQYSNVILNNYGISDQISESVLYYDREKSGLASMYHRQLDYFGIELNMSETIKLDTLDNYCEVNHIEYIDFLKMDIEGNELKALLGAKNLLKQDRIKNIQIEFGGCNIDSRTYFRDYWNLLHDNFRVYRILRDGI